jgi:hypothetical protein
MQRGNRRREKLSARVVDAELPPDDNADGLLMDRD